MKTLTIIGGGMGSAELLTDQANTAIKQAEKIYAPARLANAYKFLNSNIITAGYSQIISELENNTTENSSVIVSGDSAFYSLAKTLGKKLDGLYNIVRISGISSLQVLCAHTGISIEDVKVVSTHGRTNSLLGAVAYNPYVFVLTSGNEDVKSILTKLFDANLGDVLVCAGQALGSKNQLITEDTVENSRNKAFAEPVVLMLHNKKAIKICKRLRDEDFERGTVPMTKESVRSLSVQRLEINSDDIVYDIGAGTGSVTVALAMAAYNGVVYAIERNKDGINLIEKNRHKFGAYNIIIKDGYAPSALVELPPPTKVFIGGSGGEFGSIIDLIQSKTDAFIVCANVIALESLALIVPCLEQKGFEDIEVECINISRSKKIGGYSMMTANNPVYIISGRWQKCQ